MQPGSVLRRVPPGANCSSSRRQLVATLFLTDSAFVICAIGHGSDQDSAPTLARSRHEIGQLLLTFLDSLQLFRHGIAVVDGIVPRIDPQRTACRATGKQDRDEHTKTLADTVDIRHDQSMATRDVKTWAPIDHMRRGKGDYLSLATALEGLACLPLFSLS
jgi:hypothetical protein